MKTPANGHKVHCKTHPVPAPTKKASRSPRPKRTAKQTMFVLGLARRPEIWFPVESP